ncbi:succinate dehydrogenase, cytochrome b556 subunit [Arenimonas caeni]|jgi:succinate dehydrogenase / fumarate reductase cytochrome b subunit|uniref:Succinate dehydrogenase cytochrome b556 subunit n=2 Tax=Arenimonas caeni TaxID=2058085 RepID=A0A2P6MBA6_9GAMM|nr:succinate dehydrogenase, cytochrome b556 subunit [Arenimonas caeni]MDY0022625.1 succinate dehydrogenase, cytochrome b556 subunit [Arenimonas caeni]PRH83275.1 succinate dehydrogenase, cytochrome b556 subunit [Arenimonas caeni]
MATPKRPLSPFMLGSYYRIQLTSFGSLLHRATGVALAIGSLVFAGWLVAAASGEAAFAAYSAALASLPGKVALFGFSACLVYHLLNGIRHLVWDAGHGYEIPKAYASGYAVITLAIIFTAVLWYVGLTAGGAA